MTLRPLAGSEISPVFPAAQAAAFSLIFHSRTSPASHRCTARSRLAHRDRAARQPAPLPATQRGRCQRHAGADEGDQGRAPALLSCRVTPLHTALTVHHGNDLFCGQHKAVAHQGIYKNPGNSTSVAPDDTGQPHPIRVKSRANRQNWRICAPTRRTFVAPIAAPDSAGNPSAGRCVSR